MLPVLNPERQAIEPLDGRKSPFLYLRTRNVITSLALFLPPTPLLTPFTTDIKGLCVIGVKNGHAFVLNHS